jgi:hypothetical protein
MGKDSMTELHSREKVEAPVSTHARMSLLALTAVVLGMPLACHPGRNLGPVEPEVDITDAELRLRSPDCSDYVGRYSSWAEDMSRGVMFRGTLTIRRTADTCVFKSNGIPNHGLLRRRSRHPSEAR